MSPSRASGGVAAARLALAAGGLLAARSLQVALDRRADAGGQGWQTVNYRGRPVGRTSGPAAVLAAASSAALGGFAGGPSVALGALVAAGGAGAAGWYDDWVGDRPIERATKGFSGHLAAGRSGRLSAGLVKIAGITVSATVATRSLPSGAVDRLLAAGVVAGAANLLNLLDLRPGRALKVALAAGVPLSLSSGPAGWLAAGPVGAAAGLLEADLAERQMIGDAGANALGAALGFAAAAGGDRRRTGALLGAVVALNAASETVSFTKVIGATPPLRWLDALGRRADGPAAAAGDD
ncbi:MAG: hypothetical protein M3Z02_09640 [Actinomycetota bacterium]|nr:hypothetical protein [Actinomycetota bacterium]